MNIPTCDISSSIDEDAQFSFEVQVPDGREVDPARVLQPSLKYTSKSRDPDPQSKVA